MSTGISLAFAIGLLATITPCGLPFALAAITLRAAAPERRRPEGMRASLAMGAASGAIAGAVFAGTFLAAALVEALGVEVSDLVPILALVCAAALVVLGARAIAGAVAGAGHGHAGLFGLAYAVVSLPCALGLLQGLLDETAAARGGGGVVGVAFLFGAGVVTAMIALSLLGTLLSRGVRALGAAGVALAGAVTVAAGGLAAAYWLPAVPGGVGERGGALSGALAEISGTVGEFIADYELGFALLLVAAASAALARSLRRYPDA